LDGEAAREAVGSHIDRYLRKDYYFLMGNFHDKHLHICFRVGAVILLSLLVSCQHTVSPLTNQPAAGVNQPSESPASSPELEKSVTELITELPFLEKGERLGLLRAWTRVPQHDNYRAAKATEFENPFLTHEYGEMAGAYGLAALVVDKTRDADRFSLVIFVRRPANRYDLYWIYRNMDLSKYRMSRASGDIFVDYPLEDGTNGVCEIQWNRKQRRWSCKSV
jgi:hypothetical protein